LKVRLFRPFPADAFAAALPPTVEKIAVMDRTRSPALGEPSPGCPYGHWGKDGGKSTPFSHYPSIVGGRYALGSKEFTPAAAKASLIILKETPKNHFVGINDDVCGTSIDYDPSLPISLQD
jgi:pyruvate-ferredoxin/flavodoxin oxidoreductase